MEPKEMEQKIAELTQQVQGLAAERNTFRQVAEAWKRLGEQFEPGAIQYDANGVPVSVNVGGGARGNANPAPARYAGGHPLAPLVGYVDAEGWTPEAVDQYYLQLIGQKGYLTREEAQKVADAQAAAYANLVWGNVRVARNYDKLVAMEKYKDLANPESELAKRTAKVLQSRFYTDPMTGQQVPYGRPMHEGSKAFDEWNYGDLSFLQFGADTAINELTEEAKAATAATQSGQQAQGAGQIGGAGGAAGTVAPGARVQELIGQTAPPSEVASVLDQVSGR